MPWTEHEKMVVVYGARPLQRAVRKELETPLARDLLSGIISEGSDVVVDEQNDRLYLAPATPEASPAPVAVNVGAGDDEE